MSSETPHDPRLVKLRSCSDEEDAERVRRLGSMIRALKGEEGRNHGF